MSDGSRGGKNQLDFVNGEVVLNVKFVWCVLGIYLDIEKVIIWLWNIDLFGGGGCVFYLVCIINGKFIRFYLNGFQVVLRFSFVGGGVLYVGN